MTGDRMTDKELLDRVEEWANEKSLSPKRKDDMIRAGNEHGMVGFWIAHDMPGGWRVDGSGEHGPIMCDAIIDMLGKEDTAEQSEEVLDNIICDATPCEGEKISPKREGKMIPAKPPKNTAVVVPATKQPTPKKTTPLPAKQKPTETRKQPPVIGGATDQLQSIQDKAAVPYKVRGGKEAPTAALAMRAFNDAGGSLEELVHEHTPDYVRVTYRGMLDGRSIDATQSVFKLDYLCTKAWQLVNTRIDDNPTLILGVDPETGLPQINPDAKVKVRVSVGGSSLLKTRPAIAWFWMELSAEWLFAVRILQTQVKSIIARQLLNRDSNPQEWRESREIEHENAEIDQVQRKK